ncbi:ureidoglycolate lyase [Roseinatronobacter thiooxidans]|jgi:ureidoglycolate lyase|uniref:Ureidoglycolate lyase n=1 Tax=Roseinatronobacter thiooxidans TaxID=121821 RepID=A0A2W7QU85_9RHOB|nr:ureidoglycolate lyase [Roseinatronobacter thiooxidans]PZX47267.1 ureidoglycolate lyase [Roseinatronobacter thiooxidans]
MQTLTPSPLTQAAFAPFGDVLEGAGTPDKLINQGLCGRFHDRARLDFGPDGRAGISIFDAQPRALPYLLDMVERHPDGSQAFIPMHEQPFLVIVAHDLGDAPANPLAFITNGAQGINFHRNIWHGVLTPLASPGRFAVIDRIGDTPNLQEYWFTAPWQVHHPV